MTIFFRDEELFLGKWLPLKTVKKKLLEEEKKRRLAHKTLCAQFWDGLSYYDTLVVSGTACVNVLRPFTGQRPPFVLRFRPEEQPEAFSGPGAVFRYALPAVLLCLAAVAAPFLRGDPLVPEKDALVRRDADGISRIELDDGMNLPVVLEKHGGTWELVFDGRIRYPADNYKIRALLSELTKKNRLLREISPAAQGNSALPYGFSRFNLKILLRADGNPQDETVLYAGESEAGGGFRFARTERGAFKTEDFFAQAGIDGGAAAAMRTWLDRSPFRRFFHASNHGNIQRMVVRSFSGARAVFSAGDSADRLKIGEAEDAVAGLSVTDITNVPFDPLFEIECETGYGHRTVFAFGILVPAETSPPDDGAAAEKNRTEIYGVVSESGKSWILGAGTVLALAEEIFGNI